MTTREELKANFPTILVIFGATGDLMGKKIVPALFHLFISGNLPDKLAIVGFSRRKLNDESFREFVRTVMTEGAINGSSAQKKDAFLKRFSFVQGDFEKNQGYNDLRKKLESVDSQWGMCSNKLFYLAVPPQFYNSLFGHLSKSGLAKGCSPEEGWTRVIVEKPFGKDLATAEKLDTLLGDLFKEKQIFRVDHYLAKEMVQNILAFRFSNNLFEKNWGNELIEKIEIRLLEDIGVEKRGSFYDGIGALRDVGQNHLLQLLAFVTMDNPIDFNADSIRQRRAEVLETLRTPSLKEIKENTFRAQYDGYRLINGVKQNSATETYFKMKIFLEHERWHGVPIIIESGKRLKTVKKEVVITFKHPGMPCLCPEGVFAHKKNKVIFSVGPKEDISISFMSKKPGYKLEVEERTFNFPYREELRHVQYVEEYEKLLLDCIAGDQTLFVNTQEVKSMWRVIDPVVRAWEKNEVPLANYAPDTDSIAKAFIFEDPKICIGIGSACKKEIGVVGLGKMGSNMSRRLLRKEWRVVGYNRSSEPLEELKSEGMASVSSMAEMATNLSKPRVVWFMVTAGKPFDEMVFGKNGIARHLEKGDVIIDGGNSFYKDSKRRFLKLKKMGIRFVDVGFSGGPGGALNGASLMIGGEQKTFEEMEALFKDIACDNGYRFFPGSGAGHFVKMVHNGIEYGMMQALAEGFALMKKSSYKLDLERVADVYNHGSVVESRLVGWLKSAFGEFGQKMESVSGSVAHTGEGQWTVQEAKNKKIEVPVIEKSFKFRVESAKKPSYTGKILSALRNQFGKHSIK